MYPLFESIRLEKKEVFYFEHHYARMQRSAKQVLNCDLHFENLKQDILRHRSNALQKCKVYYNACSYEVAVDSYKPKKVSYLFLIDDSTIQYHHKQSDRSCFEKYTRSLKPDEDILICKNGLLTDTSYSNIALWNGKEWHTPSTPLLCGIRRQVLLDSRQITEKEIRVDELPNYQKIALINAMLDLDEVSLPVQHLIR